MRHPDWLHKKLLDKTDVLKQKKISEMFKLKPQPASTSVDPSDDILQQEDMDVHIDLEENVAGPSSSVPPIGDIEDIANTAPTGAKIIAVHKKKRKRGDDLGSPVAEDPESGTATTWQEALGPVPSTHSFDVRLFPRS